MSDDILNSSLKKLDSMKKSGNVDYKSVFSIIDNLKNIKSIDGPTASLLELLFKETFGHSADIVKLRVTPQNAKNCINCHHDEFKIWTVIVDPSGGHSSYTKPGQHAGDLHMQVCTKCSFCHFTKPDYWS